MPFSWLYGKIANVRNELFEREVFSSHDLGAPTISVGNITVGGTGKTPFVSYVAGVLADDGARVCVLTRGYGRRNVSQQVVVSDFDSVQADVAEAGDEPLELAHKLLGRAMVLADADRVAAARFALTNYGPSAFVLDDGFQHRRAHRDLDIVLIDATDPFGHEKTLPFGRLREPLDNLKRAGAIIITRADLVEADQLLMIRTRLGELSEAPVFNSSTQIVKLVALNAPAREILTKSPEFKPRDGSYFAFCGIGNPAAFRTMLERNDYRLNDLLPFRDHHNYESSDLRRIDEAAQSSGADYLLTTAKDAVKLSDDAFTRPCFVVLTAPQTEHEERLRELILEAFRNNIHYTI
jgi:tetraacyldisaccharide 4'-kinase